MAIDSATKRKSISGIGLYLSPGIEPNAGRDNTWRQAVAYSYSGIDAISANLPTATKRASAAGVNLYIQPHLIPDAFKGLNWRLSVGYNYAIDTDDPIPPDPPEPNDSWNALSGNSGNSGGGEVDSFSGL